MGKFSGFDPTVFVEACADDLVEIAEDIAADARRGYQQSALKTDNPRTGVIVESDEEGVRVVTYNSFAHLDEYGGPNVRSTPTGAMRAAAVAKGNFKPEGK